MQRTTLSRRWIAISLPLLIALAAAPAFADTADPASVRVVGEATVTSRPDRAELDLGVVTRAATSQQASADNARVTQNVLTALRRELGTRADIRTVSFTLFPEYQYPQGGGEPRITGYTATNIVRVVQDDLTRVGAVIDTATRAGANQIERIRFTLRDEAAPKAAALRGAAQDARAKAATLAGALGLQVVRIRAADEASPPPRPLFDLEFARGAAPVTTPILPGTIETTATVTLTVEVAGARMPSRG